VLGVEIKNSSIFNLQSLILISMGKFKKGLFIGGLLGAGITWLNVTKKGKETRDQLLDHAAVVYAQVMEKAKVSKAMKDFNKNKYVKIVKEVVDKYAIENGLSEKVKNLVIKLVSTQWKNVDKK
jgi:gas vesicle protein